MAKENKRPAPTYVNKNKPPKKVNKKLIIAVAAVLLAAVTAVVIFFVIKDKKDQGGNLKENSYYESLKTDYVQSENQPSEKYTYVNYKGCDMPEMFAKLLDKAVVDNAKSVDKNGKAVKLGDRDISYSVFQLYYYDTFAVTWRKAMNTYENYNSFASFDPKIDPRVQRSPTEQQMTYGEAFINDAMLEMQKYYGFFDLALKNNYQLSEEEIENAISLMKPSGITDIESDKNDKAVKDFYFEDVTYAMYCEKQIMSVYGTSYYEKMKQEIKDSVTNEQCKAEFESNPNVYKRVYGRIYQIESEFEEADIKKIKTEKDYLDFVNSNSTGDYDYDWFTLCPWFAYTDISSVYGENVAEWLYDPARKKGDIGFISGIVSYLLYIEELPTVFNSNDVIIYTAEYQNKSFERQEEIINNTQELYDKWVAEGASPEKLLAMKTDEGSAEGLTLSGTCLSIYGHEWLLNSERKPGDHYFYCDNYGAFIIYFVGECEDAEWVEVTKRDISIDKAYNFMQEKIEEYSYKLNDKVVGKVQDACFERQKEVYEQYMELKEKEKKENEKK